MAEAEKRERPGQIRKRLLQEIHRRGVLRLERERNPQKEADLDGLIKLGEVSLKDVKGEAPNVIYLEYRLTPKGSCAACLRQK